MYSEKVKVKNKTGIHARPASQLVILCKRYSSDIKIINGGNIINPKSIINLLSAGITCGTEIELEVTGSDEEAAGKDIVRFINNLTE